MKYLLAVLLSMTMLTGCFDRQPTANEIEARQTAQMTKEAAMKVGPPGIVNFTEKRFAKMLYELRDKEVKTYSYYLDMNGRKHFICHSIGFGIPYSVQYVNPQAVTWQGAEKGYVKLPQAEPNGLFMPDGLSATFVMCMIKGKLKPI